MASRKRKAIADEVEENVEKKPKKVKSDSSNNLNLWKDYEIVAEKEKLDLNLTKTLIELLDNENTIPFLCRYRRKLIQDTSPEKLRDVQVTLASVRDLQSKVQNFIKTLEKKQEIKEDLKEDLKAIKSFEELEFFKSLYKSEGKRTLYEKAIELGLGKTAEEILEGKNFVNFKEFINPKVEGLKNSNEILKGIKDIIVHKIAKNKEIVEEIRNLKDKFNIKLESKATKDGKNQENSYKFQNYLDFSCHSCNNLKPHQILALFRGESLKILKLSFTFDPRFERTLEKFSKNLLLKKGVDFGNRSKIFDEAFKETFSKRISPFLIRQLRSELQKSAEKAAITSFAENLKNLLLTMPVKGRKILGIDPGFKHGCKLSLISETGDVLATDTIYPHTKNSEESERIIVELLKKFDCKLIALGNGTACRETETFLDKIIKKFKLSYVEYCIVSEQGASIYSCSEIAKKEFPKMDTNLISAVSIARRLLDPLSELVKIEPKHLGVGMYQHDVDEKSLSFSLDSVVSECVSYVGIDVNCASVSLLKHIAGLTEKKALSILEHKQKNGNFKSREELKKVKSIGPKTYTQMIGFLKIDKKTAGCDKINILDSTTIHPESYDVTMKILKDCKLKIDEFGKKNFVKQIEKYCEKNSVEILAKKFDEDSEKLENVLNTLKNESLHHDYREDKNFKPDFKQGIQKLSDLKTDQIVKGVVRNIVDFGAFIDIGVQQDGLLHKSKFKCNLKLGDRVECKILNVSENGRKIGLDFVKIL
ncbi:hypothetical protein PVAND_016280 [Polypedilum vanderplanki]|uniref:S1 motif domain-containing protein n=1 Tax=Polypedilum vanderplanki TaxID=319348 RepID=A0A9J6BEM6_POLVA|nr:hypothetical protein PVAND_016280 [Polypedilum vanderplanki]